MMMRAGVMCHHVASTAVPWLPGTQLAAMQGE